MTRTVRHVVRAIRPRQWAKNILLLAGLYFPDRVTHSPLLSYPSEIARAFAGFLIFCALSGAVYLLNDVIDAPRDRLHPKKKFRPIASGELGPRLALIVMAVLFGGGLAAAYALSLAFFYLALAYAGMMIAYSLRLKEVFLIDTMIISMGFILRAVAGVIVLRTPERAVDLTPWFVICVLFLSQFIAFCKRRSELMTLESGAGRHRKVLEQYSPLLLDVGIGVSATASVLAYALYATEHPHRWEMLTTLPFVLYGVFRYLHLVYKEKLGDAPEEALLGDKSLLGCVALWGLTLLLVFYPGR